jgi:spore coat protein SA
VYDGIDREPSAAVDRAQARAHFHMSDQTVALLFAARMVPEKGLHILLQAFRAIHEAGHHQTELFVAGTTRLGYSSRTALDQIRPELSPYDQQIAALSAGLPVHFLGNIPFRELPLFYRAGDIFVCPSTWQEPFGRTNVEAMDAGLPIVASAVGGIPETVRHDYNGLLVPPEDVEALTQALTRLILDGALRQRFSQAGQEMIARFEWSVLTRQVEQIYEAILA